MFVPDIVPAQLVGVVMQFVAPPALFAPPLPTIPPLLTCPPLLGEVPPVPCDALPVLIA